MSSSRWRVLGAICVAASVLTGCAPTSLPGADLADTSPTPPRATPDPIYWLSLEQRVGQLFMVGSSASGAEGITQALVHDRFVGSVFLYGRSAGGVDATATVVDALTAQSAGNIPVFVATDQEGGYVQVLSGPGFSTMPSGVRQGEMTPDVLAAQAAVWGSELAAAGVNVNLAPVADIVPGPGSGNRPIAGFRRQYGYDQSTVETYAGAFVDGMTAAGVASTLKHFPGLGYVTGNTDEVANVTDTTIGPDHANVLCFATLIDDGAPFVMMSSAVYSQIDPSAPAVFSPTVVALLRDTLGFEGIIITDDMSGAAQIRQWTPAERAVLSIQAGVDIVLVSRSPGTTNEMLDAVIAKAKAEPEFAALVDEAARRVVVQKVLLGIGR